MGTVRRRQRTWFTSLAYVAAGVGVIAVAAPALGATPKFRGPMSSQALGTVSDASMADITGDRVPDIVSVAPDASGPPCVNPGAKNGRLGFRGPLFPYICGATADLVATGDFDGDGRADAVTASRSSALIQMYRNDGAGGLVLSASLPLGAAHPVSLVAVPVVGPDAIVVTTDVPGAGNVTVARVAGGVLTPTQLSAPQVGDPRAGAGDVNGDGKTDFAVVSGVSGVTFFVGDGVGGFSPVSRTTSHGFTSNPVLADVTGDRRVDVVAGNGRKVFVLPGRVGVDLGAERPAVNAGSGIARVTRVLVADFDRDGHPDAVANGRALLRGRSTGSFSGGVIDPLGLGFLPTDMDGDKAQDLVGWSGKPQGARVTLRLNSTFRAIGRGVLIGRFAATINCPAGVGDPLQCDSPMRIPFLSDGGPASLKWSTAACVPIDLLVKLDGKNRGHTAATLGPTVTFALGNVSAGVHVLSVDFHAQPTGGTCSGGPLTVAGATMDIVGTGRAARKVAR